MKFARDLLLVAAVLVGVLPAGCEAPRPQAPKVMPPGGNPQHTGVYDTEPLESLGGVRWRFNTVGTASGTVVVEEGVAYLGCSEGLVYAIDIDAGEEIWRFNAGRKLYNAPTLTGGLAYVGSSDGHVYAIDAATGQEVWRFKTDGGVCSPPAVHRGIAYAGSHDRFLYLLDAETGEKIDRIEHKFDVCCSPTVARNLLFYPDWGGNLHAFDTATRERLWTFEVNKPAKWFTAPSLGDGVAFHVKFDRFLHAIDMEVKSMPIWMGVPYSEYRVQVESGTLKIGACSCPSRGVHR